MIDPFYFVLLLVLGAFSGLLAGLLGIGGGLILVPVLTFFLVDSGTPTAHVVHAAIGTSLGVIFLTSISSARAHHKAGAVKWPIVISFVPGLLLGGLLGSRLASELPTTELAWVFGGFVVFSAYQLFRDKKPKPARVLPGKAGMTGAGTVIGAASALVGAGGGFLSVPFMIWSNVPVRNAVATSAVMGFPIALFSCVGYIINGWNLEGMPDGYIGYLYWPAIATIGAMSVLFAPVGAKLAHRLPTGVIKKVFAIMLTGIALSMIYKATQGF
ncbi:MAG: sulfite exporter TauE/SafE family protein [Limnobacter sp.]|nr:sulfite exporter TauE/SafE family protein [Limnobacter sp.]